MRTGRINTRVWVLLGLVLLVRGLVVPGYMPGSLAAGWPVQLCPDGLPAAFVADQPAGHAHHGPDRGQDNNHPRAEIDHCALGNALSSVVMPAGVALPTARPVHLRLERIRTRNADRGTTAGFLARAPPAGTVFAHC